jgi:autotransporter-associated beta strand protein
MYFRGGQNTPGLITLSGPDNAWRETYVYGRTTRIAGGDDILPVNAPLFVGKAGVGTSIFDLNGRNQRVAGISQVFGADSANFITNNGTANSVLTLASESRVDFNFIGSLSDGPSNTLSLVKEGSYVQILSGMSSYTGATTVKDGTLLISGSIADSAVTVEGGTLSGNGGTVGSVSVLNGGTLTASLQFGYGTLTTGDLTLADGATLALKFDTYNALVSDRFVVDGNLNLQLGNGPTLSLTDYGGSQSVPPGAAIPFLTYTGTWNGGLFEVNGVPIADDTVFFEVGSNDYTLDYNYHGNTVALVVPEPTSTLLLLGGLTVFFGRRRNR